MIVIAPDELAQPVDSGRLVGESGPVTRFDAIVREVTPASDAHLQFNRSGFFQGRDSDADLIHDGILFMMAS